jgi:lysophospholipase L1-like esterase
VTETLTVPVRPSHPSPVRTLAVLGDSTAAGLGDPLPDGRWRGFAVLLRDALGGPGDVTLVNTARTGARMADVRRDQLDSTARCAPDVAVLCAGMNDTLRSDFDAVDVGRDCAATVRTLRSVGAHVVVLRFHDHTRVFPLPGPLRRALRLRIEALNAAIDRAVAGLDDVQVLDAHVLPGGYERDAWSIDRLHPSELGHRLLAGGVAALLAEAGFGVPFPVGTRCAGGRVVSAFDRAAWLLVRGTPWLARRGRDLGPVIVQGLLTGMRGASGPPARTRVRLRADGVRGGGHHLAGLDLEQGVPGAGAAQPADRTVRAVVAAPLQSARVGGGPGAGT